MQKFKNVLMPVVLVGTVLGALFGGVLLSPRAKSFFYAFSLTLKEILLFILPLMVFAFILRSLLRLGREAIAFVLLLVPFIIISNFTSTCLAYWLGSHWLRLHCFACKISVDMAAIEPLWQFHLKPLVPNDVALIAGLGVAIFFSFRPQAWMDLFAEKLLKIVNHMLNKLFLPLIPAFIFGFALNLQESGILSLLIKHYTAVLTGVGVLCFGYIVLLYGAIQGFKIKEWISALRNMLPAALTGFSTMSSAAAMPLTLLGTTKNIKNPEIAQTVVPATVNVHLMGDCFAIPIFALALIVSFDQGLPGFSDFLAFVFYFVLAKFAVAAVPGGGILVMLPILERYLGFSAEMLSLITTLYILFDPIITSANVLGNGAFAQCFALLYRRLRHLNRF
jgi:Na+/H+-dicarboxylate symporter